MSPAFLGISYTIIIIIATSHFIAAVWTNWNDQILLEERKPIFLTVNSDSLLLCLGINLNREERYDWSLIDRKKAATDETMAEYFYSDSCCGAMRHVGSYINMTGFHWAF